MNHNTNTNRVFFYILWLFNKGPNLGPADEGLKPIEQARTEEKKHYNNPRQVIRSTAAVKGGDKKWLAGQK